MQPTVSFALPFHQNCTKRLTGLEGGRADMKRFAPPAALALPRPADPAREPGRPALAQPFGIQGRLSCRHGLLVQGRVWHRIAKG